MHGPDPVDHLVEPNVVADEGTAEKQHVLMPRHTAVRSDPSDLEVPEVVEARKAPGQAARRGPIVRGGRGVIECLVRPVLVVFAPKTAKPTLLGGGGPRRRSGGVRFEHRMELLVRPVLLRMAGQNAFGRIPNCNHQTASWDSPAKPVLANGVPLSLRIPSGNPYSANARVNRCRVSR